jgi:molecular chaperone DnaJ
MANIDDFYQILGLEPGATFEEIRAAYRNLARQVHPDIAGQDSSTRFIRINRAYQTLIDARRRSDYDRLLGETRRSVTRRTVVTTTWSGSPIFLNSLLADVVDALAESGPAPGTDPGAAQRVDVQPVHLELVLMPEAARNGAEIRFDLPVVIACESCRGTGLAQPFICVACRGRGRWSDTRPIRFFLPPPVRDGQTVTLDVRAAGTPVGRVSMHIRLSWM